MKNISRRRLIITLILLALAVAGGVTRLIAPKPSLARDMGSLLLVLWLPIIGNIIAWLVARAHTLRVGRKAGPPGFDPTSPFTPSARIELTLFAADVPAASRPIRAGIFPCALVVGSDGFSARLRVPERDEPVPEVATHMDVEFLRPELALAKMPPGADFVVLAGRIALGRGKLLAAA